MVTFNPRPEQLAAIGRAVPAEVARMQELQQAGIVRELYVAGPGKAWLVIDVADEEEATRVMEALPLRPFLDVTIDALRNT